MRRSQAEIVICGAGIAGVAAAHFLAARCGVQDVLLVDERPPLTLTSDKSTEAYRNWWPGPGDAMVRFMNRSIDLLEELAVASENVFRLNRRGYLYVRTSAGDVEDLRRSAETIAALGAGPLRVHTRPGQYRPADPVGYADATLGADLLLGSATVQHYFPYLAGDVEAALHARRCGWLSAQQLGIYLLEQAQAAGVRFLSARVEEIELQGGRVTSVNVGNETIATSTFVNAAGPLLDWVSQLLGTHVPVFNEHHGKIAFSDSEQVIPRDAPMVIWDEPLYVPWGPEEEAELGAYDETRWLLEQFPAGLHFRPEGHGASPIVLMLWPYHAPVVEPVWPPPPLDDFYFDVTLRGVQRMVPDMATYLKRPSRPYIDSGYYCKTRENRPLIGPLPVEGAFVIGALSGYGIMAAPAAGELLAAHVTGASLPDYHAAFEVQRYADPAYLAQLESWGDSGQL